MSATGAPRLRRSRDARARGGRIALDTEFMGEGRYRTLLCLIQLAVPDGARRRRADRARRPARRGPRRRAAGGRARRPADPGGRARRAPGHRARCAGACRREVRNVFDTQVAAGFAGHAARRPPTTRCWRELLGVRVAKSASFTRWDARPLSPEQLAYAREDVVHLLELAAELERRLTELGRLEWAREECEPLAALQRRARPGDGVRAPAARTRSERLRADDRARAGAVARATPPPRQDRPVQSVLGDAALMEIAKRKPPRPTRARADPRRRRGQPAPARGRAAGRGRARARAPARPCRRERTRPPPPEPDDAPLDRARRGAVRARAREAGLAYELLAARADLQAIVAARARAGERREADVRTLRGWRRELVGDELLELLDGRLSLSVRRDGNAARLQTGAMAVSSPDASGGRTSHSIIRCGCRLRTAAGTSRSR